MKQLYKISFIFTAAFLMSVNTIANNEEARQLFETSRQKLVLSNIKMSVDLLTTNGKGQSKSKQLDVVYGKFDDLKMVLVEFTGPEKVKGTKILATDYPDKRGVIEIYMPATGRIQKIKANQRNMRIMDSEIPIEQFRSIITSELVFTLLEKDDFNGIACQKIKIEHNDDSNYEILYISELDNLIIHIDKFDKKNVLLSQTEFENYQEIKNLEQSFYYPKEIKVNNLKTGKSSELKVLQMNSLENAKPEDFVILTNQN